MMKKQTGISVQLFDSDMQDTGIGYVVHYSPLEEYVPNWSNPLIVRQLPFGVNAPKVGVIAHDFKLGNLTYQAFIWGDTHAKNGRLTYIEKHDAEKLMLRFPNFFKKAEDSVRLGRALLPIGNNYGGVRKHDMHVRIVKPKTVVAGMPLEDGAMLFSPKIAMNLRTPINLGATSNNFSIFQDLDWEAIKDDVRMLSTQLEQDMAAMTEIDLKRLVSSKTITLPNGREVSGLGLDNELKSQFLELNPQLAKHPWFARGASDSAARWIASHTFAPYLGMKCYLAIAFDKWTLPEGKWITFRHPVIAGASRHAMTTKKTEALPDTVIGGAVATITGFWENGEAFTAKGAGAILPLPDDLDVVICQDNIKMGRRIGDFDAVVDAMVTIIQKYSRTALMGAPYQEFKKMNGDYDGDLVNTINASDIPNIFDNVKLHEKDSVNFKLTGKSSTPWSRDGVEKVILNAMAGSMGWATVLRSWFFSKPPEDRKELAIKIFPAVQELAITMDLQGDVEATPESVAGVLQYYVQFMVDSIKNLECDTRATMTAAAKIQSVLQVWTGDKQPGYLCARRAAKAGVAFETNFPRFISELDPEYEAKCRSDSRLRQQWQWKINMPAKLDNGVPTECFKLNRDTLENLWNRVVQNPDPLAPRTFSNWVPPISMVDVELGNQLCDMFAKHVSIFEVARTKGKINLFDPGDVEIFRNQWQDTCMRFARDHFEGNKMKTAIVLWRTSHDRGENRLTGAAFMGFPDEAKFIVTKWASTMQAHKCLIVGVKNLHIALPTEIQGTCELIELAGHTWISPQEPIGGNGKQLFGHVADIEKNEATQGFSMPPLGMYSFRMTLRPSGTAYFCSFEPL